MTTPEELEERCREIISQAQSRLGKDGRTTLLFETKWTRILVICPEDPDNSVAIEVEVALPSTERNDTGLKEDRSNSTPELLKKSITHLEYLLSLNEVGFNIDLIGKDCLWTACYQLRSEFDPQFFESLVPPSCRNS